jgi:hypothetical protein
MLDLSKVHLSDFGADGRASIQLLSTHRSNLNDGHVHGRIVLEYRVQIKQRLHTKLKQMAEENYIILNGYEEPDLGTVGGAFVASLMAPPQASYSLNYTVPSPFQLFIQELQ